MGSFLLEYGMFFLKGLTVVAAILIVLTFIAALSSKNKGKGVLKIKNLNKKFRKMQNTLSQELLNKKAQKKLLKQQKQQEKAQAKQKSDQHKKRVFVLTFDGDLRASAVDALREEVTAILSVATPADEVVVKLESPGGIIQNYGLAASQLQRFRQINIPLTVTIDKVAASGGYLMACVANKIIAAPFAIVGSIGVVAQLPNFHRLLKKLDIDFEQITAGEFKRTLTVFGENTSKGRKKVQQEVEEGHELFKGFIAQNRPVLNIEKFATGEFWYGKTALDNGLIDDLTTSDDYLLQASKSAELFEISYIIKKRWNKKLIHAVKAGIEHAWTLH